jgi:N,N'-diacetyllegionaminate synthase
MNKIMIIAEAGVNHNGDLNCAKQLIDAASEAGADAIKFQSFKAENLVTQTARRAAYQMENRKGGTSQFEMLKNLALDPQVTEILKAYCHYKNIDFISSPFDLESIELLDQLGLEIFKIPSGEITNYPYLKKISSLNKRMILSTGMATIEEVWQALEVLKADPKNLVLLHCTSDYPACMEDVNLKAIGEMKRTFHTEVGYSDHTLGIEVAIAAAALGACVIEKHFTLDKTMIGPDHKASLQPEELKALVKAVRNIEKALGDGIKKPTLSELKNKEFIRKSIVAAEVIQQGEIFTEMNLCTKRPGSGLSPMMFETILGQRANRNYCADELIDL